MYVWYGLYTSRIITRRRADGTSVMSSLMYSINFQADKQALQKELERQLSEKDKEIAALKSENEVGWIYTWHHKIA